MMETRICDVELGKEFKFKFQSFASQKLKNTYVRIAPLQGDGVWTRNKQTGEIASCININAPVIPISPDLHEFCITWDSKSDCVRTDHVTAEDRAQAERIVYHLYPEQVWRIID